jgi:hypothetical protein
MKNVSDTYKRASYRQVRFSAGASPQAAPDRSTFNVFPFLGTCLVSCAILSLAATTFGAPKSRFQSLKIGRPQLPDTVRYR